MFINHIAEFARGVVHASVSGCTDGIASRSAGWSATRPLAVAVAAAALVSTGEVAQAQFALFGIGQQVVAPQPRVVYVRKHRVAHQQDQRTSSKHASGPSDCSAIGKLDSEPQKTADAQPLNLKESTPVEKTSSTEPKKRAGHAGKPHVAGRSTSKKVASAKSDCPKVASIDPQPQKTTDVERVTSTEPATAAETSSGDKKQHAAHDRKHKGKHLDSQPQKTANLERVDSTEPAAATDASSGDKKRHAAHERKHKGKHLDSQPERTADLERVDSTEPAAATDASSGDKKRHAAHERKHKGKHRPRRLASSGKGAVKTTSCPGLARFLSEMPKTAKGLQIDPVDPKRRIAEAFQAVASVASDPVSTNDATEPTCSGVTASFYSDPQKTANGEQFDPNELTAAHRSLPFGTKLRVTNLATGQAVAVRINDRGPYIEGREIDLSEQAAASLGMLKKGLATVKLDVVDELSCVQTDAGGGSWGGQSAFRLGGSESALAFFQAQ